MTDDALNNNKKCYDRRQQEQHMTDKNNFEDDEIFLKTKTIMITMMINEWNFLKKIICNADAIKFLCAFQLLSYSVEMLYHMIRNNEMKLCDKNMLEYDDKVSLITCDQYNQSEVSV